MILVIAFISYRVLFVYTVRSGSCEPSPSLEARSAALPVPPIQVMSWNIEGHAALLDRGHVREIAEAIRAAGPTLAGLQEVHRGTWQTRFGDQIAELAGMTGMHAFFGRSYHAVRGEYGNAVLSSLPVDRAIVHPLPSVGEPRTLLETRVTIAGQEIAFFSTHLVTWGSLNRANRAEQLDCVVAHLQSAGVPWILVGDLNAPPEADEIRKFIAAAGATDAGPAVATHPMTKRRLDYILADPGWEATRPQIIEGSSDHLAVIATLHRRGAGVGKGEAE